MARTGLRVSRCAGVLLAVLCVSVFAAADDGPDARKRSQLARNAALSEGQDHLQRGQYREAVLALEQQIALIDGNREYLLALRDAYRGYIRQLQAAGNASEAKKYQEFLAILSPSIQRAASITPEKMVVVQQKTEPTPMPVLVRTAAVSRGKFDDPFDEDPSRTAGRGRDLMDRAMIEFAARRYDSAAKLFAQAERAEPGVTAGCQEQWAYCRMFRVAQSLLSGLGADQSEDLEREVQLALKMAPQKLHDWGQRLLQQIKENREPAVEVKHTPRQGNGWALAETANFRIFHAQSLEGAEKAARIAEGTRAAMTRKWFGETATAWTPKCDVYLHPTVQGYMRCPGSPPAASPGHSTIQMDSGRVISRRVDVRCDYPAMLTATLPHETTHVVLAGRFGRHNVPRWVDEGIAVLSEPRERINMHLHNLPLHRKEGSLFGVGQLVGMADYPEARLIGPFYAQSVSVVEYLSLKKGPATFTRFVREGLDAGYEAALQRHYGYQGFADLESEWQRHAFGDGAVAAVAEKRR